MDFLCYKTVKQNIPLVYLRQNTYDVKIDISKIYLLYPYD